MNTAFNSNDTVLEGGSYPLGDNVKTTLDESTLSTGTKDTVAAEDDVDDKLSAGCGVAQGSKNYDDVDESSCSSSLPENVAEEITMHLKTTGLDDEPLQEEGLLPPIQMDPTDTRVDRDDIQSDSNSECLSKSSCVTMSTTGSFGLIKAMLLDEMSRFSNHRCKKAEKKRAKRLVKAAAEPIDMTVVHATVLDHELCESSVLGETLDSPSFDLGDDSSCSSFGSFGLIKASFFDEASRLSNHRCAKKGVQNLPTEIIVEDSSSHSSEPQDDVETSSNEESLVTRNKANDEFERAQRSLRAKEEAEMRLAVLEKNAGSSSSYGKKVSFSTVEIRQYERVVGDHPSCSRGPPMSIGWEHDIDRTQRISIDEHEFQQRFNDQRSSIRLSRQQRTNILLEVGFTQKDLVRSIRRNEKVKKRRRQTVHNLHLRRVEEMAESAGRKIKKSLLVGKKEPCEEWTPKAEKSSMKTPSYDIKVVMA